MYIVEVNLSNKEAVIKMLEERGFQFGERHTREDVIESVLPITVDFEKKEISRMPNVTCTCAAMKFGKIWHEKDMKEIMKKEGYEWKS